MGAREELTRKSREVRKGLHPESPLPYDCRGSAQGPCFSLFLGCIPEPSTCYPEMLR